MSASTGSRQSSRTISTVDSSQRIDKSWSPNTLYGSARTLYAAEVFDTDDYVMKYKDYGLDSDVEEFRQKEPEIFRSVVGKLDTWLQKNKTRVLTAVTVTYGQVRFSFDELKSLLRDLGIPYTAFELHIICVLIDRLNRKSISIRNLKTSLSVYLDVIEMNERRKKSTNTSLELFESSELYVRLNMICYPLKEELHFRGHFRITVKITLHVMTLIDVILERVPIEFRTFYFYLYEKHAKNEYCALPLHWTLEHIGIRGSFYERPPMKTIYYTYFDAQISCPLLQYIPYHSMKDIHTLRKATKFTRDVFDTKLYQFATS